MSMHARVYWPFEGGASFADPICYLCFMFDLKKLKRIFRILRNQYLTKLVLNFKEAL